MADKPFLYRNRTTMLVSLINLSTHTTYPVLYFADFTSTDRKKVLFTGTRYIQKVTDNYNQYYKKPHWKHITTFYTL